MSDIPANPFIYGRPVIGKEFFGREAEIRTVLSRVHNRESTAIVGEPHIGKTSFLIRLKDRQVLSDALGEEFAKKIIPYFINLQDCPSSYAPQDFWDDVLSPLLKDKTTKKLLGSLLQDAQTTHYNRQSVEKIFTTLADVGYFLLLLLDEFDVLLKIKGLQSSTFFNGLRGIMSLTGGLVIITASRLTLIEMNDHGKKILEVGSPFFNTLAEIRLKPFDDKTIEKLLSQSAVADVAQKQIQRIAGRHPFVLQAMAAAFVQDPNTTRASEECYKQIKFHFKDIWSQLPDQVCIPAVILCLNENQNKIGSSSFRVEQVLKNKIKFRDALKKLEELGEVEKITKTSFWQFDWDTFFNDHQETWAVASLLFMWWVYDVIQNPDGSVAEFLKNKQLNGFLTDSEWEKLLSGAQYITNIAMFMEKNIKLFEFLGTLKQ